MLGFLESPKAIKKLNEVVNEREKMINFILSTKNLKTDSAWDRAEKTMQRKSYSSIKKQFDNLYNLMYSK